MNRWARIVSRTAWFWVIAWPVVAILVSAGSPTIQSLLEDDATDFIPPDMPSQRAAALLRIEFPDSAPRSRAVVICQRDVGLTAHDFHLIDRISDELATQSERWGWRVHSHATDPHLASIYRSPDGQVGMVVVDLPASPLTHSSVKRVRQVQDVVRPILLDSGLDYAITGGAALGELLDANAKESVNRTTIWAFVAVMVILLLIYRSPVAMLLPIVTIATALLLSLGLVGWAASVVLPINGLVEIFIVVILVGTGVDYCLFLFARFREELRDDGDVTRAVEASVARCGGAILASAGTNAAALATLALARNRDLYTSGPTIAVCICIATFAVLTLTPAMMKIVGARLFWPLPVHRRASNDARIWKKIGEFVVRRPVIASLVPIVALLPAVGFGIAATPVYDAYHEFPPESDFVRGAAMYRHHYFDVDHITDMTLIVSSGARLDDAAARRALHATLDKIADTLRDNLPVLYIRDLADPLGQYRSADETSQPGLLQRLTRNIVSNLAATAYIGQSGTTTRIDLAVALDPRAVSTMEWIPRIQEMVRQTILDAPLGKLADSARFRVDVTGDTPLYADMRTLRRSDFKVVAVAAVLVVFAVLLWLLRSPVQSLLLIAATMLTYIAAYGMAWLVCYAMFGYAGLNWQIDFIFFIVILSLGQDYNIFVVTRIAEERKTNPPAKAVANAIWRTGHVVSSCGIIMAATFASMLSGSLVVMRQFAVAFALGVLLDSFIIRPLVVPALILLLDRDRNRPPNTDDTPRDEQSSTPALAGASR